MIHGWPSECVCSCSPSFLGPQRFQASPRPRLCQPRLRRAWLVCPEPHSTPAVSPRPLRNPPQRLAAILRRRARRPTAAAATVVPFVRCRLLLGSPPRLSDHVNGRLRAARVALTVQLVPLLPLELLLLPLDSPLHSKAPFVPQKNPSCTRFTSPTVLAPAMAYILAANTNSVPRFCHD